LFANQIVSIIVTASVDQMKCEHGRQKYSCKDCGGAGICQHGRKRSTCKDCRVTGVSSSAASKPPKSSKPRKRVRDREAEDDDTDDGDGDDGNGDAVPALEAVLGEPLGDGEPLPL
jgi:hypothetical protein